MGRVEEIDSPCPVVLIDAYPHELEALLTVRQPTVDEHLRTWGALAEAAGLPDDGGQGELRVGARIPVAFATQPVTLSELVVVEIGKGVVVAAESHEAAAEARTLLRQGGLGGDSTPGRVAAVIAHLAAESLLRNVLEGPIREVLVDYETKAVAQLGDAPTRPADEAERQKLKTAVANTSYFPVRLQKFRADIGAIMPRLEASGRERCDSWRFGSVRFTDVNEQAHNETREIYLALTHVAAAVNEAHRLRRDALDAITTVTAATQGVQTDLVEATRQATEAFQIAATALTAALAGPGLLFALWAVDLWAAPWYATFAAGVFAMLLLLAVWLFLRRRSPQRRLTRAEASAGVLFVVVLVGAGVVAPPLLSDPSEAERTRNSINGMRDDLRVGDLAQQEQLRLLRRELRRVRVQVRSDAR